MSNKKIINGLVWFFVFWVIFLLLGGPEFLSSLFLEEQSFSDLILNMWIKGKIFFIVLIGVLVYYIINFLNNRKYKAFLDELATHFSLEKWEYIFDADAYDNSSAVGRNTFCAIWGIYEKYFVTIWRSSMRLSADSMTGNYHIVVRPKPAAIEHKKAIYEVNEMKKELSWIAMLQTQWNIVARYNEYRKEKWKRTAWWKERGQNIEKVWLDRVNTYVFDQWVVVFFTEKDSPSDVGIKLEWAINLMLVLGK